MPVLLLPAMELPKQASGMDPSRGCIMKLRGVWQQAIEGKHLTWKTPVAEPSAPDSVQSPGNALHLPDSEVAERDGCCWGLKSWFGLVCMCRLWTVLERTAAMLLGQWTRTCGFGTIDWTEAKKK